MDFSRRANSSLASLKRFDQAWNKPDGDFVAYIFFHPDCSTNYQIQKPPFDYPTVPPQPRKLTGFSVDTFHRTLVWASEAIHPREQSQLGHTSSSPTG
jgi:hypothetical protein